jgi:hypothetical protein
MFLDPYNVPKAASGLVALTYFPENEPGKWQRTAVNLRLAKRDIMESLEFWVDTWIKERKAAGLSQQKPLGRIRLGKYIEYLKVYDLKKEGRTYREIADVDWMNSTATELDAKRFYDKAVKLILNPPLLGKTKPVD